MNLTPSSSSMAAPSSSSRKNQGQNIQVYVRVRPLNADEMAAGSTSLISVPRWNQLNVKERSSLHGNKTYTFDHVFDENSRQEDVYRAVVRPLIAQVLRGYNCTVFAYGQTGTGKTYTMEGLKHFNSGWERDPDAGIIPRALVEIFNQKEKMRKEENSGFDMDKFQIKVSFLELYKEEIFDLLSKRVEPDRKLKIYEKKKGVVWVQDLEERIVRSKEEVLKILEDGSAMRQTAATKMNASSSRSHTIFTVTVNIPIEGEDKYLQGKINLVDLAGSENARRSGAEGERLYEAGIINKSLLTLGNVINDLVRGSSHIPYRESKLTRLLQDSLGGKTKTSIIATVSPASMNVDETQSTLFYANNAKSIKNTPEVNQKVTLNSKVAELQSEVDVLRKQLVEQIDKNGGVFMTPDEKEDLDKRSAELEISTKELNYLKVLVGEKSENIERLESEIDTIKSLLENVREQLREKHEANLQLEYVVERQTTTEQKLQAQALSLIEVAKSQERDLAQLHCSHERKMALEKHNFDAVSRLQQRIASNLDEKGTVMNEARQLVKDNCNTVIDSYNEEQKIVSSVVGRVEEKTLEQRNQLLKNLDTSDEMTGQLKKILKDALQNAISSTQKVSSETTTCSKEHHKANVEYSETLQKGMLRLEETLQAILNNNQQTLSELVENASKFSSARTSEISKAEKEKREASNAHSEAMATMRTKIGAILDKIEYIEKNLTDSGSRMSRLQIELKAEQKNHDLLKQRVEEQKQDLKSLMNLSNPVEEAKLAYQAVDERTNDIVGHRLAEMIKTAESKKAEASSEVEKMANGYKNEAENYKQNIKSAVERSDQFVQSMEEKSKSHQDTLDEIREQVYEESEQKIIAIKEHSEAVKKCAKDNQEVLVSDLQLYVESVRERTESNISQVKQMSEKVEKKLEHAQALDDVVRSHNERFVSEEHKKDRPSGETPKRVNRDYPTAIVQGTPNEERKRAFALRRGSTVDRLELDDVDEGSADSDNDDSVFSNTSSNNVYSDNHFSRANTGRSKQMLTTGSMNDSSQSTSDIENKCPNDDEDTAEFTVPSKTSSTSSKLRAPKVFGSSQVTTRSRSSSRNRKNNGAPVLNAQN